MISLIGVLVRNRVLLRWLGAILAITGILLFTWARSPAKQDYAWFESLGFPDVKGKKYVRYSWGPDSSYVYAQGFLIEKADDSVSVFTPDLRRVLIRTNEWALEGIKCEELDFGTAANAYLGNLLQPTNQSWFSIRFGKDLTEPTETFVMAWACYRTGYRKLARKLHAQADINAPPITNETTRVWRRLNSAYQWLFSQQLPRDDLRTYLETDIGNAMTRKALADLGNPKLSRMQLLGQFEKIIERYPRCELIHRACETEAILRRMVAEDELYAMLKRTDPQYSSNRVSDWIFQLRRQENYQVFIPGPCDIFAHFGQSRDSPAQQLLNLGYEAVPQLILSLEDKRFTRAITYQRFSHSPPRVLNVGECALEIMSRIAGRKFESDITEHTSDRTAASKPIVEAWWTEIQAVGEFQSLVKAVKAGDGNSIPQATKLLEKYPHSALDALLIGARKAQQYAIRAELVNKIAQVDGDEPVPHLKEELLHGPHLLSRIAAAVALHNRGYSEAVTAMIHEWDEVSPKFHRDESMIVDSLIRFLIHSNKLRAVDALRKDLVNRDVGLRLSVLLALAREDLPPSGGEKLVRADDLTCYGPQEVADFAIERLLLAALEDTEERTGSSGSWGNKSYSNPRICDIAGHVLSVRWPDKYPFDLTAPLGTRDALRIQWLTRERARSNLITVENSNPQLFLPSPRN